MPYSRALNAYPLALTWYLALPSAGFIEFVEFVELLEFIETGDKVRLLSL
jgi:hypothetical protein